VSADREDVARRGRGDNFAAAGGAEEGSCPKEGASLRGRDVIGLLPFGAWWSLARSVAIEQQQHLNTFTQ
jgi:hypothetical protein